MPSSSDVQFPDCEAALATLVASAHERLVLELTSLVSEAVGVLLADHPELAVGACLQAAREELKSRVRLAIEGVRGEITFDSNEDNAPRHITDLLQSVLSRPECPERIRILLDVFLKDASLSATLDILRPIFQERGFASQNNNFHALVRDARAFLKITGIPLQIVRAGEVYRVISPSTAVKVVR
jgi:hypothetical protein